MVSDLSPSPAVQPLRRLSASQQLHDLLRDRIIALELAPGAALSRNDLADQYGVSQTPVRDALQKLEQEGLVTVYPQSRTEVTRIDLDQARETQFLRLSLELEIARTLAGSDKERFLPEVTRILSQQQTALRADRDLDRFKQLDRQFHLSLFAAAGVAPLWEAIEARSGHIDRLRALNLMDEGKAATILEAHREIMTAIGAGDSAAAQAAVRAHLSGTLASVDQIRQRHPEYF